MYMENRVTVDYGIDLGTTNSAICRMERGEPVIVRSDFGIETMPSCVLFRKNGTVSVGQSAYDSIGKDKLRAFKKNSGSVSVSCAEFKRFMGSDKRFAEDSTGHAWTPEELSAQVLRTLCSFVNDEKVRAAVITVPAKFTANQKDATLEAARLAGIEQVELLQEPIAASMAYGLNAGEKNGVWMIFDLGGGTLDVALVHICDGVMQVLDTEGDNYLGGKNLDEAIVSEILLPGLTARYSLNLADGQRSALLKGALKVVAERLKIILSYCDYYTVSLEAGDWGEDDNGEEIEMEMTVTRAELEEVMRPILQKAVDVCLTLIMRNNIVYGQLTHLILVGGPTYIPLLRSMLREQVTDNVAMEVDPMTVVAKGAAVYASTIPLKVRDESEDVLRLMIDYEATDMGERQFVPVRVEHPVDGLTVRMIRCQDGWESSEESVGEKGCLLDVALLPDRPNTFCVAAAVNGVRVKCYPSELTIVQGIRMGLATLPYNIGTEVFNPKKNRCVFASFTGLEKNRPLPAKGTVYGLKTMSSMRPGAAQDVFRIPVYQGDDGAEGKTAALFEYVSEVVVSGEDVTADIPVGSLVNICVDVDSSEMMTVEVEFPEYGRKVRKPLDTSHRQVSCGDEYLRMQISQAHTRLRRLAEALEDIDEVERLTNRLRMIERTFSEGAQHKQVEQHLREVLRSIENLEDSSEWERQKYSLQKSFIRLRIAALRYGDDRVVGRMVESFCAQTEKAVRLADILMAKTLQKRIEDYEYALTKDETYRAFIRWTKDSFENIKWKNAKMAESLVGKAMHVLEDDPQAPLSKIQGLAECINALIIHDSGGAEGKEFRPHDLLSV